MKTRSRSYLLTFALAALMHGPAAVAASAATGVQAPQTWTALGGDLGFIWNVDLLRDYGIALKGSTDVSAPDNRDFVAVPLRDQGGLSFAVTETNFDHFVAGRLALRGGFSLTTPVGEISLVDAVLVPRGANSQKLDVVDATGKKLFYLDRLMYVIADEGRTVDVQTMDLRLHEDLAHRLGKPEITDWVVAQMRMRLNVVAQDGNYIRIVQGAPVWPGTAVAGVPGATYQADVFMLSFQGQYSRCSTNPPATGTCDGPAGATDGYAVFTPSSTLRNNVNHGTFSPTVAGDPNGTSTAQYSADVAWYRKFSGTFAPYDNDQHPNLIWNLYRIDANNRIEQIGRSGVKHAFVTTNTSCDNSGPGSGGTTGAILGLACSDTYGTSNNDSNNDLGPRSEIIPATGQWGRCGSIFDPNCTLTSNTNGGNNNYSQRMITRESQLAAGGTYYFESWYIVRDDINIYNTMSSRPVTFNFGSSWSLTNGAPQLLGPVINRWVSPTTSNPNQKNVEIANAEGHTRVAVNVVDLGGGQWRYDYAVMNLDFARAVTQGTGKYSDDSDPAQRFRVIHNFGFDRFSVPLPEGLSASSIEFNDGDLDAANNWTGTAAAGTLSWTAPVNPTPPANTPAVLNPLNWGTMFRFSFVTTQAPTAADIDLHVAQSGTPASYTATVLAPSSPVVDLIYADDFEEQL
ncbi:hypothetical protein [Tahibacter sp.]|uniref:hypothetical protein n=1 Tax=Tahibacter sp. TaxID=2056211 RepID=UPI0028C3D6BF|nr:hypothetical protein [Tahibacter sp.]